MVTAAKPLPSLLLVSCLLLLSSCSPSGSALRPHDDRVLQQNVEALVKGFRGDVGVYVRNLTTGQMAACQPDTLFPTASMIKVPILCGVFDKINKGELTYGQELVYRDSLKYDDGVTGSFRDSTKLPLAEIVMLMIALSDNTASLWLQQLAGTGTTINAWLENNGFHQTRVNSRTPGRQGIREIYGWGHTTPRDMAELMALIYQGRAVSPDASEQMFRVLSKPFWDGEAVSQIPPTVHVASKSGAVNASKSEVVLVNGPSGDYVFCVITKNQKDQRWEGDNEGYVLIRRVSRMLWEYFEPDSKWKPAPGSGRWEKPNK
ncbi:MAG: class A beta-lactamase-related serine hydrolase [Ignavibacteriales bacterium]|nr:class A beta-lactamase-related serine hydrolase [Ignavibacteriales bacterium]